MKIVVLVLLFGCVVCVAVAEDEHGLILPNEVSYTGPRYVMKGTNFTITCHLPHGVHLKWTKNKKDIATDDKRYTFGKGVTSSGSHRESKLGIFNATSNDNGHYKCYAHNLAYHEISVIYEIVTNEKEKGRGIILEFGKDVDLQCSASEDENVNMTWFKNGEQMDMTGAKHSLGKGNNTLTIHNTVADDAGKYTCAIDGDLAKNANILLKTRATVEKFDKSMNLVQGDKLRLYCKVFGYPVPTVTWLKDNVPVRDANSTSHVKLLADERNITDSILLIEHLEETDRAQYTCLLANDVNSVNMTIMVRVKDKLAALWPFLGILAEVAILCTIIFIYEKRRAKQEYEESDTDQNNESKPIGDQKDKDVRQRK